MEDKFPKRNYKRLNGNQRIDLYEALSKRKRMIVNAETPPYLRDIIALLKKDTKIKFIPPTTIMKMLRRKNIRPSNFKEYGNPSYEIKEMIVMAFKELKKIEERSILINESNSNLNEHTNEQEILQKVIGNNIDVKSNAKSDLPLINLINDKKNNKKESKIFEIVKEISFNIENNRRELNDLMKNIRDNLIKENEIKEKILTLASMLK